MTNGTNDNGRRLSDDEADLWEKIARSAKPLPARQKNSERGRQAESASKSVPPRSAQKDKSNEAVRPAQKSEPEPKKPPSHGNLNRRDLRRISSGRTEIDARLDLHGMRQAEAHNALTGFILNARARGHRTVLVVTGKGNTTLRDPLDTLVYERPEPGVLKRLVPQWLEEPTLRDAVISTTAAHPRHGGEGAMYIRLRRSR